MAAASPAPTPAISSPVTRPVSAYSPAAVENAADCSSGPRAATIARCAAPPMEFFTISR